MTVHHRYRLTTIGKDLAVCQLAPNAVVPDEALRGPFCSVTRTPAEISLVCQTAHVPAGIRCEPGWSGFMIEGPFDFSTAGVLDAVTGPLARAGIGVFVISTFDTDYILVKTVDCERSVAVLHEVGHEFRP
jgi:uncharacterized protein